MLLSASEINRCLENGRIQIQPFNKDYFKEGSYSFTLSNRLSRLIQLQEVVIGQKAQHEEESISAEGYVLEPGAFAIFYTQEKITLANDILCLLSTRGSVAKLGIDMLQSSLVVEPGSDNVLALETYNHGPCPVRMIPGVPVVKGVFFRV